MSSTSRPPPAAGAVAHLDDAGAGLDQAAQHGPLGDDPRVVGRVGGGRHARDQRVQVGRAADAAEVAGVGQRGRDGDRVGRLAPAVEVEDRVEDRRVDRPVEVVGLEDLDDVGDRVLGQQHAAEHALLGRDVLRWCLVVLAVARRGRTTAGWTAGWRAGRAGRPGATHVICDRHEAPSRSNNCTVIRSADEGIDTTEGTPRRPAQRPSGNHMKPGSRAQTARWTSLGTTCGHHPPGCARGCAQVVHDGCVSGSLGPPTWRSSIPTVWRKEKSCPMDPRAPAADPLSSAAAHCRTAADCDRISEGSRSGGGLPGLVKRG